LISQVFFSILTVLRVLIHLERINRQKFFCPRARKSGVYHAENRERRRLMILLDYKDRRPIYEQVVAKLEELMLFGVMKENEPLPSVRSLAMELSINPNTIQRAYVELERQGYIYTVKGKGSFVADNQAMKENKKKEVLLKVSDMIDEAIRVGIPGEEIKNMVEIQYEAARKNGGGDE